MFHDLHEVTTLKPSLFLRENDQPANRLFCCCGFFLGNIDNSSVLGIQRSIFETPLEWKLSFSGFIFPWPPGARLWRSHGRVKILRFRCKNEVLALQGGSLLRVLISYANKYHVRSFPIANENHSNHKKKLCLAPRVFPSLTWKFIYRRVSWSTVPLTLFAR